MCGSSKSTSNQNSSYTPTAQASGVYSNVFDKATAAAGTPYNPATGKTIADFTPAQLAAFNGVQAAQGTGHANIGTAGQLIDQGGAPITAAQIQQYADPHEQAVIDATMAQARQNNAVAQSTMAGNAAASQALGGNRVGVAQATLAGEQGRNDAATVADLRSRGFTQALTAAQADKARQLQAGQQQMNLGQVAQGMTYADLQAMLQSGQVQQTQQQNVNDAASSNATAAQMYPYQNAQWLAGIASALGPLTGGTSTGTSTTSTPKGGVGQIVGAGLTAASMLSDRRAKENVTPVGKTFDGQTVYSFRYKGSPKVQMGLIADEVQRDHPDAVGQHPSGFQMVDYGKATDDAAERGHFASGGGVGFDGMWNQLKPSAPIMPQLPAAAAAPAPGGGSSFDPQKSVALGKSARAGIDNILRKLSPTQGWAEGTGIEPAAGAAGVLNLGSLFSGMGFAPGGPVLRLDQVKYPDPRRRAELEAMQSEDSMPMAMGDPNFMDVTTQNVTPGRAMPDGYAPGGAVDFSALIPRPKLKNEFLGEIGDSGIEPPADLPYGADPFADIGAPSKSPEPSPWGMSGISPTYQGKTLADFLGGKAPPQIDMGAEAMPTVGADAGAQLPPMPERAPGAPGRMNMGDIGMSTMDAANLQELPGGFDPEPTPLATGVEEHSAAPGLSTLDFIKQEEGFAPIGKRDGRQNSSGYGTKARLGERITREEAERRLVNETGQTETWLDRNVKVPLSPGRRTALVSFAHNLGVDDLQKLLPDINAGDWDRVAKRMLTFNKQEGEDGNLVVNKGLTNRRIREAALVSDNGDPATTGGIPAAVQDDGTAAPLVAKGSAPEAPVVSSYSGPKDKKVGGLLKTMFGVEFNPLKLDENERMALMAAGLSMMSTGNIGAGGLTGLDYLTKARSQDRDAARDAQTLALQMAQTQALSQGKWHPSAGGEIVVNDVTGETRKTGHEKETGTPDQKEYEQALGQGFQGTLLDYQQAKKEAKGASGSVPSEVGARMELANAWMKNELPSIRERVKKFTNRDYLDLALGRGNAAEVSRRIETGSEALIRMMTGAGKSAEEARAYATRYSISATDRKETMLNKLAGLERDLVASRRGSITSKTGEMARDYKREQEATPDAGPAIRPRARNARGDVIEFDGNAWVPAQ
jgi:GH24 family phage-related lysozyme (muramidase)